MDSFVGEGAVAAEAPSVGEAVDPTLASLPLWQEISLAARICAVLNRRSDFFEIFGQKVVKQAILDGGGAEYDDDEEFDAKDVEAALSTSTLCFGA